MKRKAAIDIGSNSVRLLVAQTNGSYIKPLYKDLRTTRLGAGVDARGMLSPKAVETTLRAVREFKDKAISMGAEEILAIATSAVRDAANGDGFMEKVGRLGLRALVLEGGQEAEIGFIGAALGCKRRDGGILLVDIGGGSTELVLGKGYEVIRRKSLDIGAVRMTERFIKSDPVKKTEMEKIEHCVTDIITQSAKDITAGDAEMTGIGGTVTTLAAVARRMERYDSSRIHGYILAQEEVCETLRRLSVLDAQQRRKIPGLQPGRADIIVAGTLILKILMGHWGFEKITVSEWDNLEGALYQNLITVDKNTGQIPLEKG